MPQSTSAARQQHEPADGAGDLGVTQAGGHAAEVIDHRSTEGSRPDYRSFDDRIAPAEPSCPQATTQILISTDQARRATT
jgi:hypothetical protein